MEIEANEFSAAVLIPDQEYREERATLGATDLGHIETLRLRFGVSKEAMARRYVHASRDEVAIVFSQHGRFRRCVAKASFPYLGLRSNVPLPQGSLAKTLPGIHAAGYLSNPMIIRPETWLESTKNCAELTEQVLVQRDGWTLTMLVVERIDEDSDHPDVVEEAWAPPTFANR